MSKLHIGPHTRHDGEPDPHPAAEAFDREINLKAIFWTTVGLVVTAVVAHLLMWWMIKGFRSFDQARDPKPSPLREANIQPPPPLPRLQTTPEADLTMMRSEEDTLLGSPAWVNRQQGTVRIPIDVAMEVVVGRGLGPEVVGGTPGAAGAVPQAPGQPGQAGQTGAPGQGHIPSAGPGSPQPGALVQMSRQPEQSGTVTAPTQAQPGQTPPPPERR